MKEGGVAKNANTMNLKNRATQVVVGLVIRLPQ